MRLVAKPGFTALERFEGAAPSSDVQVTVRLGFLVPQLAVNASPLGPDATEMRTTARGLPVSAANLSPRIRDGDLALPR